jgi:hypothetical protein
VKKFLFLDFDGVLHPTTTTHPSELFSKNRLLEETLQNIDCEIVISSSWRFHTSFESLISNLPMSIRKQVTGVTGDPYVGSHSRYNEITQYLKTSCLNDVKWISLDDSVYEFPENCLNLIQCNPNTGLTIKECSRLSEWLVN